MESWGAPVPSSPLCPELYLSLTPGDVLTRRCRDTSSFECQLPTGDRSCVLGWAPRSPLHTRPPAPHRPLLYAPTTARAERGCSRCDRASLLPPTLLTAAPPWVGWSQSGKLALQGSQADPPPADRGPPIWCLAWPHVYYKQRVTEEAWGQRGRAAGPPIVITEHRPCGLPRLPPPFQSASQL